MVTNDGGNFSLSEKCSTEAPLVLFSDDEDNAGEGDNQKDCETINIERASHAASENGHQQEMVKMHQHKLSPTQSTSMTSPVPVLPSEDQDWQVTVVEPPAELTVTQAPRPDGTEVKQKEIEPGSLIGMERKRKRKRVVIDNDEYDLMGMEEIETEETNNCLKRNSENSKGYPLKAAEFVEKVLGTSQGSPGLRTQLYGKQEPLVVDGGARGNIARFFNVSTHYGRFPNSTNTINANPAFVSTQPMDCLCDERQ